MGKHPVSTTISLELNKQIDELCKGKCSKYKFIREAIQEKVEKTKIDRENKGGPDSRGPNKTEGESGKPIRANKDGFESPA